MGWREVMYGREAVEVEELPEQDETDQVERDPGWHEDPDNPGGQRYWDGERWGPALETQGERPTGKANRLAVTALILACLAPVLVGGILATVFGYVALDEIEDSEGVERGKAIAHWAIGLGFLNIALSCAFIVYVVAQLSS